MAHIPVPANCPHKLTKTAVPWLGGGATSGASELRAGVTSAAVRFRYCMLVAAAAAPPEGGRHGGRLLQLRVITLGGRTGCEFSTAVQMPPTQVASKRTIALRRIAAGGAPLMQPEFLFLLALLAEAPAAGQRPHSRSSGLLSRPLHALAHAGHRPHVARPLCDSRLWRGIGR